ncbi:MAG: Crp/Fnr family transcriptional regulator [Myxococcales bacterium]|nr:Crp/Fnr family transcriptional regulator [Myxococcales bacterium]MCB9583359.1 Crp/Fnr family transcriptional regulator [Polyangiaceae bacterium]
MRRPAGAILIQQDEKPRAVLYVRRGQVAIGSASESGAESSFAVRGPDTLLGLEVLIDERAPYQVTALTDVVFCALEPSAFLGWVGQLDSPMGAVLELAVAEAGRRVQERHGLQGTAVRRVARFLLKQVESGTLSTPQNVVATVLGMRPETLSRALAKLRTAGALAPGRTVRVTDSSVLDKFANE